MSVNSNPWNPSQTAINKVKDPLPVPVVCNCCNGSVRVAGHGEVYGKTYGKYPWMYLCEDCGAYVGMHPFTNIPLGTLADAATRKARNYSKKPFEEIWQSGIMTRTEAYRWLAKEMGKTTAECHFGLFTKEECNKAYAICKEFKRN